MSAQRACPWVQASPQAQAPARGRQRTRDREPGLAAHVVGPGPGRKGLDFNPGDRAEGPARPRLGGGSQAGQQGGGTVPAAAPPAPAPAPGPRPHPPPGWVRMTREGRGRGGNSAAEGQARPGRRGRPQGAASFKRAKARGLAWGPQEVQEPVGRGEGSPGLRAERGHPSPPALTPPQAPARDREARREEDWATHETWCPRGRGAQGGGVQGAEPQASAAPGRGRPHTPGKGAVHSHGVWCPAGRTWWTHQDDALVGRCGGGAEGRGDRSCGFLTPEAASSHRRAQATPVVHSRGLSFPSVGLRQGARPAGSRGRLRWTHAFPQPHRVAGYRGTRRCPASCPPAHPPSRGPLPAPGVRPAAR